MPQLAPLLPILRSRWLHYALLAMVCAGLLVRGNHYRSERDQWRASYEAQKKAYTAAAAAAEAAQKALNASIAARQADKARTADEHNRIAQSRARGAAADYADRMRVDRLCARPPGAAAEGDPAGDRHGPGGAAEYVAVNRNDFDILVSNSVRLEEVRRWGENLMREGLAEPLPEPEFAASDAALQER